MPGLDQDFDPFFFGRGGGSFLWETGVGGSQSADSLSRSQAGTGMPMAGRSNPGMVAL